MKQYILSTAILFLTLTSTIFAIEQKPDKPLESGSRIQLNEETGQWEIVGSYITRPTCSVPPIKDLLIAPYLVDRWIDNGCIKPAELEKVLVPIVKAIPAEKVKDNINGYDLLSRLAPSNKQYREKMKCYEKRDFQARPKERPEPAKRKKEICTKNVDDNGFIEETLDVYFSPDRFGPKPHSLNDWCYDKDNNHLFIDINYKNESKATAKDLARSIGKDMIMTSRTMKQVNQLISPFQKYILSKGITVIITWPGLKSPAAWEKIR